MRILDRYIASTLFRGYSVVLLVLTSLFSFLAFVQELDEVGHHNYRLADAAVYVALTLPQRILDLAPVTVLLGGLLGLGTLARGNELLAVMTSGLSLSRFAWSVGKPAIILTAGCALLGQFIAPPLQQLAEEARMSTTATGITLLKENGLWSRDRYRVLHVRQMWKGQIPCQIELYEFDSEGRLSRYLHADRANALDAHHWELVNVQQKIFMDNAIIRESRKKMIWRSFIGTRQLEALRLPAQSLSPSSLYQYIRYLEETQQSTARFELILWHKLSMPLNVGVMALLAVPFGFALLRSRHIGRQLLPAAGIGVLFFLLNQIIANIGLMTGAAAPVINLVPLAAVIALTGFLFRRVARTGVVCAVE
jgi:lipopolysaccharide export system permease protein